MHSNRVKQKPLQSVVETVATTWFGFVAAVFVETQETELVEEPLLGVEAEEVAEWLDYGPSQPRFQKLR
jgi:hypothetical protein